MRPRPRQPPRRHQAPGARPPPAEAPAAAPAAAAPALAPPIPTTGAAGGGFDTSKLTWSAPPSWQKGGDRMMRVVTYTVGQSEAYVTVLDGPAGGVEANLNRWRGQMEQPNLTPEELAKLPKIPLMGKDSPFVQVSGTYTTMSGPRCRARCSLGPSACSTRASSP